MWLAQVTCFRGFCQMSTQERRRLDQLKSMQFSVRDGRVLIRSPSGLKGGTVVPPCDFHGWSVD